MRKLTADWDRAADPKYLAAARALIKAAHPDETPLVVDPFAGGGSIPLEALRLGCDTFASDLNPVAVLINKVMLEDIPRYGKAKIKITKNDGTVVEADGLAAALRIAGAEVVAAAEKELAEFYPPDQDGRRPIAYLWARTVKCESPNCGAEIPLLRSFWLAKTLNRRRALRYFVRRLPNQSPHLEFEVFSPKTERDVPSGTVSRARATCPCCNMVLSPERVRAQLYEQAGGADSIVDMDSGRIGGATLMAVVVRTTSGARDYRTATLADYKAIKGTQDALNAQQAITTSEYEPIPDEPLPPIGTLGFRVQRYGMLKWGDLFTSREKLTLLHMTRKLHAISSIPALHRILGLTISRFVDDYSSLARWMDRQTPAPTFSRHALPLVWDYCEIWPFDNASWSLAGSIEWTAMAVEKLSGYKIGQIEQASAISSPLTTESAAVWFTDPPYYDAIPYSDLSDFFFVWLKRLLPRQIFDIGKIDQTTLLTPKQEEIVQDPSRSVNNVPKDSLFFEQSMATAFKEGNRVLQEDGIGAVVFAHKTTEGWEALLTGITEGGWTVVGSWPIATERPGRLRSLDSAALATSVHLVCRKRDSYGRTGDWAEVLSELPRRVSAWMDRLENEGVRGADLVFACIGPALEIYSQFKHVLDAEDRVIPLGGDPTASDPHKRGYLAYVWETVARLALQRVLGSAEAGTRNGAGGALEEDARLTALFLWTLQTTDTEGDTAESQDGEDGDESGEDDEQEPSGRTKKRKHGMSLPFDVARRFAQPLGIHLPQWENRIIETDKGVVRLLPVTERLRQLFGEEGAEAVASQLERNPPSARDVQMNLYAQEEIAPRGTERGRSARSVQDGELATRREATTLDRVHAAMLLQKSGRTNALRALLTAEQESGPAFLRLANALSGLYPRQSEEKRLVDAMLLAYPK